jgi:kinesin family member 11
LPSKQSSRVLDPSSNQRHSPPHQIRPHLPNLRHISTCMAGPRASAAASARKYNMRRSPRPSSARAQSVAASRLDRSGAASPADSVASTATSYAGTKRKERDFERNLREETNINVVVRCRGRNEREVRENSGVVLSTDGVKGATVKLSMGPTALSNKTYHFDKVFAPAADQSMIYDDVVTPILDEVSSTCTTDSCCSPLTP